VKPARAYPVGSSPTPASRLPADSSHLQRTHVGDQVPHLQPAHEHERATVTAVETNKYKSRSLLSFLHFFLGSMQRRQQLPGAVCCGLWCDACAVSISISVRDKQSDQDWHTSSLLTPSYTAHDFRERYWTLMRVPNKAVRDACMARESCDACTSVVVLVAC
jgi:hypothetical protein